MKACNKKCSTFNRKVWKYIFLMHLSSLQTGTACTLDIWIQFRIFSGVFYFTIHTACTGVLNIMHLTSVTWKNGDIFTEACKLLKIRVQVDNGQATLNLFVMKQAIYEIRGMDIYCLDCRIVVGLCLLFSTFFTQDRDLI